MGLSLPKGHSWWPDELRLTSTEDCIDAYANKRLAGAMPDPEALEELEASPYCLDADSVLHSLGMADSGKGLLNAAPYKALLSLDSGAYTERQTTGDCVSHGNRNAVDVSRACEIVIKGELELWIARGATEPIYGARGHGGQGANCQTLANWVCTKGGLLVRKNYPELDLDLSKYDSSIGSRWGSRGVPEAVRAEAAKTPCRYLARIKTWEEARDFAANGYGIFWCAGIAYSGSRDENGVAKLTNGSWAHSQHNCMIFDDSEWAHEKYGEALFGIAQSWGTGFASGGWNAERYGPAHGSVSLLRVSVLTRVIRSGWVAAIGDFQGFKKQADKLKDFGAGTYL